MLLNHEVGGDADKIKVDVKTIKHPGFVIGLAVTGALLLYFYSVAVDDGRFVPWEYLGMPPEKAIKVLAPGFVKTTSGRVYQYLDNCTDLCWQHVETVTTNPDIQLSIGTCGWMPDASRYSDFAASCEMWGVGVSSSIFAIDGNGGVYSWQHRKGEGGMMVVTFAPCIGALLGFGIGILILLLSWLYGLLKKIPRKPNRALS